MSWRVVHIDKIQIFVKVEVFGFKFYDEYVVAVGKMNSDYSYMRGSRAQTAVI